MPSRSPHPLSCPLPWLSRFRHSRALSPRRFCRSLRSVEPFPQQLAYFLPWLLPVLPILSRSPRPRVPFRPLLLPSLPPRGSVLRSDGCFPCFLSAVPHLRVPFQQIFLRSRRFRAQSPQKNGLSQQISVRSRLQCGYPRQKRGLPRHPLCRSRQKYAPLHSVHGRSLRSPSGFLPSRGQIRRSLCLSQQKHGFSPRCRACSPHWRGRSLPCRGRFRPAGGRSRRSRGRFRPAGGRSRRSRGRSRPAGVLPPRRSTRSWTPPYPQTSPQSR